MGPFAEKFMATAKRKIAEAVAMCGYQSGGDIPEDMTFRQWCQDLAARGMKIDGKPFSLEDRPALIPLYDKIPTTKEEARGRILAIQKATQLGMTVWEILAMIYMALKFGPVNIGFFLPDQSTAAFKSEHRFMRIVRSVPELLRKLIFRIDAGEAKETRVGEGNILTRVMGESIFLFLWTTGKVTTESRPMDIVGLDEVQEMTLDQIDKVMARMGDSDIGFALLLSTANMPESDINFWYLGGTQEIWHTECPSCRALSDLSDPVSNFPDRSIAYNDGRDPKLSGAPLNEYVWRCPECGGWIEDPQVGRMVVTNPGASYDSMLYPRVVSPKETPRKMIEGWSRAKTGDQKKSYYNRRLARPYIDSDQLPVTMAHCEAAARAGIEAGVVWKKRASGTYMGIDQMGSFNVVIIKERMRDGRQAVIHVEGIFDDDPFARCDVLMAEYGVAVCVVEQLPNVNDARRFANRHRGRVFLAGYADMKDDMMMWSDDPTKSDRRTAEEDQTRYTVTLNQYKAMQTALYRIRGEMVDGKRVPMCLFPDPDALEQDVLDNGKLRRIPILRDWAFLHFTKTALIVEYEGSESRTTDTGKKTKRKGMETARKTRTKVAKVGIDPHFSFANMLCDVAWARVHGSGTIFIPQASEEDVAMQNLKLAVPELAMAMRDTAPPSGKVCGACHGYDRERENWCKKRGFAVKPADPGCMVFLRRDY